MKSLAKHPLGVKPSGNALLDHSDVAAHRQQVMGLFGVLSDELLMMVVQELDQQSLLALGHTCKALFAYTWFDELWKQHVYNDNSALAASDNLKKLKWKGSWRCTALGITKDQEALVSAEGKVYSDFVHRPYQLSCIDFNDYIDVDANGQIPQVSEADLTVESFDTKWHKRPFVANLTAPIAAWTMDELVAKFGNEIFRQEYMDWPLQLYVDYARANNDEVPLYLFDCKSKAHKELNFTTPLAAVFGPERDFFALFGNERPDHQWLIIGPPRSGSTFHKDPNNTSAWNSVVSGHKYWIMFPQNQPPPGVYTNDDQSEVTAPVSLAEWFVGGFYEIAKKAPGFCHAVTGPGQVMYVPSGWWHAVVNLDECIAMTGNFVAEPQVPRVMDFLRTKADQISGFRSIDNVYERFKELVQTKAPELCDKIMARKRTWREVSEEPKPFTFNFSI